MNSEMSLQLEGVRRCIRAVRTLIWPLARMAANVTLQLAKLNTCIVALVTLVRLFVRVSIANVSNQFSRSSEGRFAEFAEMRLDSGMSVNMVGETGNSFEASLTNAALVGSKRV